MNSETPDTDTETDQPPRVWAKVRLRVERAAIPTLGELEGVRLVVETTSGGWFVKVLLALGLAVALAHFGVVPMPW